MYVRRDTGETSMAGGPRCNKPLEQMMAETQVKERLQSQEELSCPGRVPHSAALVAKRSQFYKTRSCPWYVRGRCDRGSHCNFAHSVMELRPSPDLTRTSICSQMLRSGFCRKRGCRFAHSLQDLRATDAFYKTLMCPQWAVGLCRNGEFCRMAHGGLELRHNPALDRETRPSFEEFDEASDGELPQLLPRPSPRAERRKANCPPPRLSSAASRPAEPGLTIGRPDTPACPKLSKPSPTGSESTRASPHATPHGFTTLALDETEPLDEFPKRQPPPLPPHLSEDALEAVAPPERTNSSTAGALIPLYQCLFPPSSPCMACSCRMSADRQLLGGELGTSTGSGTLVFLPPGTPTSTGGLPFYQVAPHAHLSLVLDPSSPLAWSPLVSFPADRRRFCPKRTA